MRDSTTTFQGGCDRRVHPAVGVMGVCRGVCGFLEREMELTLDWKGTVRIEVGQ